MPASGQVTTCPTGRLPPSGQDPRPGQRLSGTRSGSESRSGLAPQIETFYEATPSLAAPESPGPGPVGSRFPSPGPAGTGNHKELTGDLSFPSPAASAAPRVTLGKNYRERALAQPAAASVLQLVRRAGSFPFTPALAGTEEGKEAGIKPREVM